MTPQRDGPGAAPGIANDLDPASTEFQELRDLLVGPERRRLDELKRRVDASEITPANLAEHLPEAISLRSERDRQLGRALAPTVENALRESVRRDPREIAAAIFPVLGPAIRKAIAETMAGLVRSINTAIEHSLSIQGLKWRLEAWRTGAPYAQVVLKHALVYRVEQIFLIHAETGLLLAHVAPSELHVTDADLISGMLTAIQDFVSDSFKVAEEGGRLRSFSVGELTVMVEPGPRAVLAAVVRGTPPDSLLRRLQDTLETLHVQFAQRLAEFDGDTEPFRAAQPMLEDCLETVLTTDRARRKRHTWLLWVAPLLLVAGWLGWRAIRAERNWRRVVAGLQAEPGIVVVTADRSGSRYRLSGLRDPLAGAPAAVLAGLGVDTTRVFGRWEAYLSLDPPVVLARARRLLVAPPTATLALDGETLRAGGTAPVPWLQRTAALASAPPGVARIDLGGVEPLFPGELGSLRDDIERRRVLFAVGSAEITREAGDVLAEAAWSLRRLIDGVGGPAYRLDVELAGRTDSTGTETTNETLSQLRVEAVRRFLAARGVADNVLRTTGLGTASPLAGEGGEARRAALNRSVSFAVRVVSTGVRGATAP
ncbi:MAG: OmpA family protein [Gemmatimonadales bacterium]